MQVELGNPAPHSLPAGNGGNGGEPTALPGPQVTYVNIPDDVDADGNRHYGYTVADSAAELARDAAFAIVQGAPGGVTRLPGQEALLAVTNLWASHGSQPPSWVWSDNDDFAVLLGHYFRCPVGRPDNVEDTHYTASGAPGVGPPVEVAEPVDTTPSEG